MRHSGMSKIATAAVAAMAAMLFVGGVAVAVSGGGYDPAQQDCAPNSSAYNTPYGHTEKGCHYAAGNLSDGNGNRYAEVGLDQLPREPNGTPEISAGLTGIGALGQANSPHSGCAAANTNGTGGGTGTGCGDNPNGLGFSGTGNLYDAYCPVAANVTGLPARPGGVGPCAASPDGDNTPHSGFTPDTGTPDTTLIDGVKSGEHFYFGMDDNFDAGEHDGVSGGGPTQNPDGSTNNATDSDGTVNGPSDGGAITADFSPQDVAAVLTPKLTNPVPFVGASVGFCADGICFELTSRQQDVYQGCGANPDVTPKDANGNPDPSQCPGGRDVADQSTSHDAPQQCNSGGAETKCGPNGIDSWRMQQASHNYAEPGFQTYYDPDPQRSAITHTPGIYAGTCGVIVPVSGPAASLANNGAGQLVVRTGC